MPPGEIPVVQLNLAAIAMEMGLDRDVVDQCIREFIGAFSRSVNIGNQANLGFKEIGQLVVKEGKAKMKFFKEFLRTVDGSNSSFSTPHLLKRLNTMDSFISRGSVMSSASLLRPNTFMLPSATNRNVWTSGAESDFPERPPSVVSNHGGNLTLSPLDTLDEVCLILSLETNFLLQFIMVIIYFLCPLCMGINVVAPPPPPPKNSYSSR